MSDQNTPANCDLPEIGGTSFAGELARVIRYGTAALGGYLVARGYMSAATVELVTGVVVTATPLAVGMILARVQRRHVTEVVQSLKATNSKSDSDGA